MESAIGKLLSYEEVMNLKNGTKIWVESDVPRRNVFLGEKVENDINNLAGQRQYSVADTGTVCNVYAWNRG